MKAWKTYDFFFVKVRGAPKNQPLNPTIPFTSRALASYALLFETSFQNITLDCLNNFKIQ